MAERKGPPSVRSADDQRTREAQAAHERAAAPVAPELRTADGGKGAGPKSSIKTGKAADGSEIAGEKGAIDYSVQCHTDDKGLFVLEPISAKSGDEAALKALKTEGYKGLSVRGVTPYSDPDANSLGGEREAENMIRNAANNGSIINTLGTEANAEATENLAKGDIKELGE